MKEKTFGHRPYTFDRVVRMSLGALIAVAAVWLIYVLRNVLLPFGVAAVVAYLLEPMVQFNRRLLHLKGRVAAVFVTLFGVFFAVSAMAWALAPSVIAETRHMGELLSAYLSSDQTQTLLPGDVHRFLRENLNLQHLGEMLSGMDWVDLSSHAMDLVSGSIDLIISICNWLLTFLYVIFIMIDYERLGRGMRAMVPPPMRKHAFAVGRDVKESMNRYFRGQALVALCVGLLFCIGFLIMGMPLAIPLGLFIGVLNLVPYLQLISIPVTAMLCLVYTADTSVHFWTFFGEAMLVYIVVQIIQDLFLTPKIMGKAMGLNPAIILLSLSVWGTLFGLLGMIVALPMTTLLLSYYERYVIRRRSERRAVEDVTENPHSLLP